MYYGIYKCRLCGEQFTERATSTKEVAFDATMSTVLQTKASYPMSPSIIEVHFCDDGSYGIGDFLGMKFKQEKGKD